jgi:hypothetical protein
MQRTYGDAEAYQHAGIDAQWGQSDLAIHWLETGYRPKDGGLMDIRWTSFSSRSAVWKAAQFPNIDAVRN